MLKPKKKQKKEEDIYIAKNGKEEEEEGIKRLHKTQYQKLKGLMYYM